tara:strand:- start:619 stop:1125 length:507 start_codon:yes stop_codon:yes gene_type:complete
MILSCNSCGKKFVVPDQAITLAGRTVQCGSCGNKWKQFPLKNETKENIVDKKNNAQKKPAVAKIKKQNKKRVNKSREINLYSPEYLKKKHGINLNNVEPNQIQIKDKKVSFGFYNYLIVTIVSIIFVSRGLYFFRDFLAQRLPSTKFYLDYFFESIRNIFEIWKNLVF